MVSVILLNFKDVWGGKLEIVVKNFLRGMLSFFIFLLLKRERFEFRVC